MKKIIVLLIAISIFSIIAFASQAPPEFDPILEGDGIRVLLIDDFEIDHGSQVVGVLYSAYPMTEIVCVDFREAKSFHWQEEFDLIIVMNWFDTEREVKRYISSRILEAETMKIAPAGNADPPYDHDNALGEWFVLIGANGHEDWCQGEIKWNEGDMEGTCGATAEFATELIGQIIERRMYDKERVQ